MFMLCIWVLACQTEQDTCVFLICLVVNEIQVSVTLDLCILSKQGSMADFEWINKGSLSQQFWLDFLTLLCCSVLWILYSKATKVSLPITSDYKGISIIQGKCFLVDINTLLEADQMCFFCSTWIYFSDLFAVFSFSWSAAVNRCWDSFEEKKSNSKGPLSPWYYAWMKTTS